MSKFLNGIKSFVHSISTSDHYASYDPSRSVDNEDSTPLATSRSEHRSSSSSLGQTYVPGMRSAQMSSSSTNLTRSSNDETRSDAHGSGAGGAGSASGGGIPLADMTPIPSAELSWNRIDAWIEQNYPELYDQLLEGATSNDLNDLEHDLDCALPQDVRESYSVHDGQEPGGKPTGVFFGISLLDLEGISEEWNVWRRAALKIEELSHRRRPAPSAGPSSSASASSRGGPGAGAPHPNLSWIEHQRSCPPNMVQPVYAHPSWIPLAKDLDGNNIAVDLAPGPKGRYGQVILFGRDFDTKYVVAPSWGDFLAQFAADLESGQCYVDEDIENAVFAFKLNGQLVSYFNVLRRRVERTLPPKQNHSAAPPRRNMASTSVSHAPVNSGRVTPRLISPTSSSSSLPLKDKDNSNKSKLRQSHTIAGQFNEIDLNGDEESQQAQQQLASGSRKSSTLELKPSASQDASAKKDTLLDRQPEESKAATTETLKAEPVKAEPTKAEPAKAEPESKIEEPEPKAEETKIEEPKTEEPKTEEPKTEETKTEEPKTESEEPKETKEEPAKEPKKTEETVDEDTQQEADDDAEEEAADKTDSKPAGASKKKNKKKKGKN